MRRSDETHNAVRACLDSEAQSGTMRRALGYRAFGDSVRSIVGFALAAAIALGPSVQAAIAAPPASSMGNAADAARLHDEAMRHYKVLDFREALDLFKRAYLLGGADEDLINIGRCYEKLGEKDHALAEYRAFVASKPAAASLVQGDIDRLQRETKPATPVAAVIPLPAAAAAPPKVGVARAVPIVVAATPPPVPPDAPRPLWRRPLFWGIAGGAATLIVAGVVTAMAVGGASQDPTPSLTPIPVR